MTTENQAPEGAPEATGKSGFIRGGDLPAVKEAAKAAHAQMAYGRDMRAQAKAALATQPVMFNGLTEAETNETASVKGLTQSPAEKPETRIRAALSELVALKDMKDRLQQLHESGCGTDYEQYHRRKPLAWAAARAALADTPQAERPQAAEFCWLVELFLGDGTGNSLGWYHTGFTDLGGNSRSTQDPLKAKRYSTWREANLASVKLGHTLQGTWRAVEHGFVSQPPVQPIALMCRACGTDRAKAPCPTPSACALRGEAQGGGANG